MSMTAKIGITTKRINSTKQDFSGSDYQILLKDPVSRETPTLLLAGNPQNDSNYMYWDNRYYWVDDIVFNTNGTFRVFAHLDPLATYKDCITNSSGYVAFGPSGYKNSLIDDPRFGPDIEWDNAKWSKKLGDISFSAAGAVLLTVVAATDLNTNGVITYVMSYDGLQAVMQAFGSLIKSDFDGVGDVSEVISNAMVGFLGGGSWTDSIKSCIWVPFNISDIVATGKTSETSVITIGGYQISGFGYYLTSPLCQKTSNGVTFLEWDGDTDDYKFLRYSKYNSLTLVHPSGTTEIDCTSLANQASLYHTVVVDYKSGDYYVYLRDNSTDSEPLAMAAGNCSIDIMSLLAGGKTLGGSILSAESKIATSAFGMQFSSPAATTTSKGAKSATSDNSASSGPSFSTAVDAISTGIDKVFYSGGFKPTSCTGSVGNTIISLYHAADITNQFFLQRNSRKPRIFQSGTDNYKDYCDMYGYPCNNFLDLASVTGYVQCSDISVEPTGTIVPTQSDLANLNSMLCKGIYIE